MKTTHNKNVTNRVKVLCSICKNQTQHVILMDTVVTGEKQRSGNEPFYWTDEFQIVQCLGCENTAFRKTHTNSEDVFTDANGYDIEAVKVDVFPNPDQGRTAVNDIHFLPINLRMIYEETIKALNNRQCILTGIGMRAIMETVCKDKNASGKDLYGKINDLVTQTVLTPEGAEILHQLRTLGNDAVHEVKYHSPDQLNLAFDVVDNLLQSVYVLPRRAEVGLPKREE